MRSPEKEALLAAKRRLKTALSVVKMSKKGSKFARAVFEFLSDTYYDVSVFWDEEGEYVEFITSNGSVMVYDVDVV
jgi:hypothetical protein